MSTESKVLLFMAVLTFILLGTLVTQLLTPKSDCICDGSLCYRLEGGEEFFCEDNPIK